jgi:hypothetical protein
MNKARTDSSFVKAMTKGDTTEAQRLRLLLSHSGGDFDNFVEQATKFTREVDNAAELARVFGIDNSSPVIKNPFATGAYAAATGLSAAQNRMAAATFAGSRLASAMKDPADIEAGRNIMRLMGTPHQAGETNVADIMQYLEQAGQQPGRGILPGLVAGSGVSSIMDGYQ